MKSNRAGAESRAQGSLLGQIAGDSLGSLVEFQSPSKILKSYPLGPRELEDGGVWGTLAGQPTDDSEMALELARTILEYGGYNPGLALDGYRAGYAQYQSVFGGRLFGGVFCNIGDEIRVALMRESHDRETVSYTDDLLKPATRSARAALLKVSHRRKLGLASLPRSVKNDLAQVFESLAHDALSLSKSHKTPVGGWSGGEFSAGFVRFNMVAKAQQFTLWLMNNLSRLEEEHGCIIKTNCYTSALDSRNRKELEKRLGLLLNRKTEDWTGLPEVMAFSDSCRPVVYVLATTPIIEVGRDYDFDWAILEPSSDMSIIQSSGRVLRHRVNHPLQESPNVLLMDASIRELTRERGNPYGEHGPGFQQAHPLRKDFSALPWKAAEGASGDASSVFGAALYSAGIHAGHRLSDPVTPADKADRLTVVAAHMDREEHYSIREFIETENPWRDDSFLEIGFRESEKPRKEYIYTHRGNDAGWVSELDRAKVAQFSPIRHGPVPGENAKAYLFAPGVVSSNTRVYSVKDLNTGFAYSGGIGVVA